MRKILGILVAAILSPVSAWSMALVEDTDLSGIIGQAGVSIEPNVIMNVYIQTAAWGDATGLDSTSSDFAGYVGLRDLAISNLRISTDTQAIWGSAWKPITIDVATMDISGHDITFVRFGIGALEMSWDYIYQEVALGPQGYDLNRMLGELQIIGLDILFNPGSEVLIYNGRTSGECGITMTIDTSISRLWIYSAAWGDIDGSNTGYVGFSNVNVMSLNTNGVLTMDIVSHGADQTVLETFFPSDFNIHVGRMTADVKLDGSPALNSTGAGTLGSLFINGLDLTINGGGRVDISAH